MANYLEMNREELTAEKAKLNEQYKKFLAMNLKLNMARGKPGPHQMDLAMGLLQMNDYTTDAGTDARNYGDLEGLHEARVLFADVFGVKPEEVFVGGNSSLQLMYNLINIGYVFGFPESPCPWSQVEKRKFLCPVPGYDRHFAITEEYGFELISVLSPPLPLPPLLPAIWMRAALRSSGNRLSVSAYFVCGWAAQSPPKRWTKAGRLLSHCRTTSLTLVPTRSTTAQI